MLTAIAKRYLVLVVLLAISACATPARHAYEGSKLPFEQLGFVIYDHGVIVRGINGKAYRQETMTYLGVIPSEQTIALPPGWHKIKFQGQQLSVKGPVYVEEIQVRPGEIYRIQSRSTSGSIRAWISKVHDDDEIEATLNLIRERF